LSTNLSWLSAKKTEPAPYISPVRTPLFLLVAAVVVSMQTPAMAAVSTKGSFGQVLTVDKTTVRAGSMVTVSGRGFDETVGIYLAFCVVPKKGSAPTPCGGGVNKAGMGEASYWISSNPPPYAVGLTDEFLPGGRFTHTVKISRFIGKVDCRKVKCAVTVRADHLRSTDRTQDLYIPITISK
jgi:hypothetical protein